VSTKPKHRLQESALSITRWVGSPQSIVIHTLVFIGSFAAVAFGVFSIDRMLLVLTTLVSLEAIYLSIFIQMTINVQAASLEEVEQDIDEIQEDIDEIQEDVDEIQEDVEEMTEDEEIQEKKKFEEIHAGLQRLMHEVERIQRKS
jgi:low affinity Fe/Cu permease